MLDVLLIDSDARKMGDAPDRIGVYRHELPLHDGECRTRP
jgi:hypothetical protein